MRYGEVASALLENLDDMRKNFQNILIDYSPNDIFNMDETGLYWKMETNCTLSTGPGKKLMLINVN